MTEPQAVQFAAAGTDPHYFVIAHPHGYLDPCRPELGTCAEHAGKLADQLAASPGSVVCLPAGEEHGWSLKRV